ncbi:MAG: YgiQ family radical SAM protein [Bacillota bacterium]|nr:YgiQ family radical SAM protein [Bacillota bacterium]
MPLLPSSPEDLKRLHWETVDFVLVTGDAYIDHPGFGAAIIGRVLEREGFRVAVLSQPDWRKQDSFSLFGKPRLGFLVTGGNIDSMVAHYTVAKRKRHDDKYTPGNVAGKRPDRAVLVYCQKIREAYSDVPIIIGGIEGSLRRLAHYDYWDDKVRPSVLWASGADILVYGMGERQIAEIARRLGAGEDVKSLQNIGGTVYLMPSHLALPEEHISLPSFEKVSQDKKAYAQMTKVQMEMADHVRGKVLAQRHGDDMVVQNPPALPLNQRELDAIYELPYTYSYPKVYDALGGVKALEEVEFSLTHNRGCFGGCNFCSIAIHQGRYVVARSHKSLLTEAQAMTERPNFKGYIHDVGGATANFRGPSCEKQKKNGLCAHKKCLYPEVCSSVRADHSDYVGLLRKLRDLPKVKKVFIRSGIRYDYLLADRRQDFLKELVEYHVSGQLRVAPEHASERVLRAMGKPGIKVYEDFSKAFYAATKRAGKDQYVLPYLMSSHPGSTMNDAVELAVWLRKHRIRPEQVQDFYPTPGTVSTCMYYTGLDPMTIKKIYVPRSPREKQLQRALLQSYLPENKELVRQALAWAHRTDLLYGPDALIRDESARQKYRGKQYEEKGKAKQKKKRKNPPRRKF